MKGKSDSKKTNSLELLQRDFNTWRKTRNKRKAIPDHLLDKAVRLSHIHGITKICKQLKLNYITLKRHSDLSTVSKSKTTSIAEPSFLELCLGKQDIHAPFIPICEITIDKGDGGRICLSLANEPSAVLMQTIKNL
jgi:hypothetical protein